MQLRPHYGQQAMLDATSFCTAAIAGTGGGKTVGGYAWSLLQMVASPGNIGLVAEPTHDMLNRVLLTSQPGRMSYIEFLRKVDPGCVWLKSQRILRHKLGTIIFASADRPETFQGVQFSWCWLDEAGLMSREAWLTAVQRAAFYRGRILLTTTPYDMGWLYLDVAKRSEEGDRDYTVVNFPSTANPRFPRESLELAKRTMSATRVRMLYEGRFGRPEGMVYDCFESDSCVVDDFPVPGDWERIGGLDFGFNNPTAGALLACNPDGVWYLYAEHYQREQTLSVHAQVLRGLGVLEGKPWPHTVVWYHDPSAAQQALELRRLGLGLRAGINEVMAGIDTVYALVKSGRLKVFRSCKFTQDEFQRYVWKRKDGVTKDEPVKENDHLMDAVRYALHTRLSGPRLALHV